ncbi:hypothetical protein ABZ682_19305 [Streptomyces griseoviridis]|uniref:hypothetical protein n=1 Tax=Streptomyces griseoviridis TaxID=45398 RepID=UPI0033C80E6B
MHPLAVEQRFLDRAGRLRRWGAGLLICASLFWAYAAWQVLTPYGSTYNAVDCPAPVDAKPRELYFDDGVGRHEDALQCASDRSWPAPLAALAFSVPLSVAGTGLLTAGAVSAVLRRHDTAVQQATAGTDR